jgi:hypothetical protein
MSYTTPILGRIETAPKTDKFIKCTHPIEPNKYDALYEHWGKPTYGAWEQFLVNNDVTMLSWCEEIHADYRENDDTWYGTYFFLQRTDRTNVSIMIDGHDVTISPNYMLLCKRKLNWQLKNPKKNKAGTKLLNVRLEFDPETGKRLDLLCKY